MQKPLWYPKWPKLKPYLWPKWLNSHILWGCPYLHSPWRKKNCYLPGSFCISWGTPLTSNCNVSCHVGQTVLYCTTVRCSWFPTITTQYGSDLPVGSITGRFRPSTTAAQAIHVKKSLQLRVAFLWVLVVWDYNQSINKQWQLHGCICWLRVPRSLIIDWYW